MRRLIIVYNPRSSRARKVEAEVLAQARQLRGWTVGKYAVRATNVDDNAARLAAILQAGDLVVAAGGDATATIAVNAIMQKKASGKKQSANAKNEKASANFENAIGKNDNAIALAVLGYGNFNDHATMLKSGKNLQEIVENFERKKLRELYPLEVRFDDRHWRYAAGYFSVGMFAESTRVFDEPAVRKRLQQKKCRMIFSMVELASWYFRRRKQAFIPGAKLNDKQIRTGTTDLLMVNSPRVAKMMRGGDYYLQKEEFWLGKGRLGSFWRLVGFMMKSILKKMPGEEVKEVRIELLEEGKVVVQAEGESEEVRVQKIVVKKSRESIKIIS